jgi:hypothetical protein
MTSNMSISYLENKFSELTYLLYDTEVPLCDLSEKVYPYMSEDVVFKDPWQVTKGKRRYMNGGDGFHCGINFTFDIYQLSVKMNEQDPMKGRCLVDGTMNLDQLRAVLRIPYTYPLRTQLVYEFELNPDDETKFLITVHEEMWSFADMLFNLPLGVGWMYDKFRIIMGHYVLFTFFYLCCLITWIIGSDIHRSKR